MTALVSLFFITMIPLLIVKLQIFPYTCLFTFWDNNYNIGELRMTKNSIFAGATPIF